MELQECVYKPEDIDELFKDFFGAEYGASAKIDEISLGTVGCC